MEPIEPSLAAKFALVTHKGVIQECSDLIALRNLACQLLEANAATKALLLHHMREGLPSLATVHPPAPVLAPKPVRKATPFTTEQRWYLCHDERGAHYRWGLWEDLAKEGVNPDSIGHE